MIDILATICSDKKAHILRQKKSVPETELLAEAMAAPPVQGFHKQLAAKAAKRHTALICEIKKASPSKGIIRADFNPVAIAQDYTKAGAACISVLTDIPYFQGHDDYLKQVRKVTPLPLLRKDFMLDPYQIIESRALGADCILLIMAALSDDQAKELESVAHELGMDVLIEVHNAPEMERALTLQSRLIGINNRNLKTLEISLTTTEQLMGMVPESTTLVCESGIHTRTDIERMESQGVYAFLVGESLMKQADIGAAVWGLLPR